MFKDFEFFTHTYSVDFDIPFPIIEIPHINLVPILIRDFSKSETFKKYKGIIFKTKTEKVTVDLNPDLW